MVSLLSECLGFDKVLRNLILSDIQLQLQGTAPDTCINGQELDH